jgi:hypothetical protein
MRNRVIRSFALAFAGLFPFVPAASAQNAPPPQSPVTSPRPGVLNLADDGTQIRREDETEWIAIAARKRIRGGDSLRTTGTARAEMLLTPGAYLRLDRDTEVEMLDDAPDRLAIALRRGAVIFEIFGPDDANTMIRAETPTGAFVILRPGLYRVQTPGRNHAEIHVHRGALELQDGNYTRFEGRRRIYLDADGYGIGSYFKLEADDFDSWSEGRSRRLADANARLRQEELRRRVNRPTPASISSHPTGNPDYAGQAATYSPNNGNGSPGYQYPPASQPPSETVYVISEYPPPACPPPANPSAPTPPQQPSAPQNPPQPGTYNPGPPQPGGYNTGPVNPPKTAPETPTGANSGGYNNGGQPPANDAKVAPAQPSQPPQTPAGAVPRPKTPNKD